MTGRVLKPLRPGELDKVPRGNWVALVDGRMVACARSLEELMDIMEKKGYSYDEYIAVKLHRHDLMAA
ncbi:MAG: DUF5678 domain-containing protein [Desulfurococcales archaeon]|nr:DUF5678 domain-containing protein [Desulfurococcales archaeon]